MRRLFRRLEKEGVLDPAVQREIDSLRQHGIFAIASPDLQEAVIDYLTECAPTGFFTKGATRTGKHHPSWQNGPSGILRNTTECCLILPGLASSLPDFLDDGKQVRLDMLDIAYAATIVSDSLKWNRLGEWSTAPHEIAGAKAWTDFALPRVKRTRLTLGEVLGVEQAVRWHHGVWSADFRKGQGLTPESWLVHLSDTVLAQKALEKIYEPKQRIDD